MLIMELFYTASGWKLRAEVNGFSESIKHRVENGMNGSMLEEWESI